MIALLLLLGAIGHLVLWVGLVNRVHSLGIARKLVHVLSGLFVACFTILPPVVVVSLAESLLPALGVRAEMPSWLPTVAWVYVATCAGLAVVAAIRWLVLAGHSERRGVLLSNHSTRLTWKDDRKLLVRPGVFSILASLPGNQVLELHVQKKELRVPRLAAAHDGLRLAHLTDLHMSGRVAKPFYERVVEQVNALGPDLVAITGDLVEGDTYLEWLPDTLGRLRARHGVFYVLGNHDRRASVDRIKSKLAACGLIHLGDRWQQIDIHGAALHVGGNELPWFRPAANFATCPRDVNGQHIARLLLAHAPDQFGWAQANEIDLMMAGHLHGGQVRLPVLGAMTSPSRYGVRYAAGVFQRGNTVMHVSRGIGALTPVRFNCPPELALLVLRR
ncbi:MAG: metallophosphoesterase [Pirellulales bacterium]|nr:metallophosphoesterase [Pirellulales bacterium]